MVLDSQASRPGTSRRYMVSRRRRPSRWPWVLAAGVGLAIAGVYWFGLRDDADSPEAPVQVVNDAPAEKPSAWPTPEAVRPNRVEEMAPPPPVGRSRPAPAADVPQIVIGASTPTIDSPPSSAAPTPAVTPRPAPPTVTPEVRPRSTTGSISGGIPRGGSGPVLAELERGMNLIADRQFVEGRHALSRLLFGHERELGPANAQAIRDTLTSVNRELVFSPTVVAGDPLAEHFTIQRGDLLARVAPKYNLTYQFLEQINGVEARQLQIGQQIKVIRGPFHARIAKSDFRMDLFLIGPDGMPIYVRSFEVGLGEGDSTPAGKWIVEENRKVQNPGWRNPRTGEYYKPNDPANPIGEYWLALKGVDAATQDRNGYGIHGTIEPDSIGRQASMGCVRLRDADIEQVYHLLVDGDSTVEILP